MHRLFDPVISPVGPARRRPGLEDLAAGTHRRRRSGVPEYHVDESGPDHQKSFRALVRVGGRVYGSGQGRSKKEAEQQAAEAAWSAISTGTDGQAGEAGPEGNGAGAGRSGRGWAGGGRPREPSRPRQRRGQRGGRPGPGIRAAERRRAGQHGGPRRRRPGFPLVPELPEVEVVRRGLERTLSAAPSVPPQVLHPRAVRRHAAGPDDFAAAARGRTVTGARRRGKYLWLPVAVGTPGAPSVAEDALLAHLGMSGQLLCGDPGRPVSPHVRVRFTFTDSGPDLRFTDQRTFGHLRSAPGGAVLPLMIAHIAPDPMEPGFDEEAVHPPAALPPHRHQARAARSVAGERHRQHLRRRGAVARPAALGPPAATLTRGRRWPGAGRRARGPGRGAGGRRHLVRQPVRERQRGERLLRPVTRCLRARGRAVPAVRHAGPPGPVHEPVRLQLPGLPATPRVARPCDLRDRST